MVKTIKSQFKQLYNYLGYNQIGDDGLILLVSR